MLKRANETFLSCDLRLLRLLWLPRGHGYEARVWSYGLLLGPFNTVSPTGQAFAEIGDFMEISATLTGALADAHHTANSYFATPPALTLLAHYSNSPRA